MSGNGPDMGALSALIVEDNEHMRVLLRSLLLSFGLRKIAECVDGHSGLEELAKSKPDFILTDLSMIPMDGIEFTRKIRHSEQQNDRLIPIIMISGHTEKKRIEAARDAGVTEILAKPITVSGLVQRIDEVILRPRPFVNTAPYFGPCRRRHTPEDFTGPWRRKSDTEEEPEIQAAGGSHGHGRHSAPA